MADYLSHNMRDKAILTVSRGSDAFRFDHSPQHSPETSPVHARHISPGHASRGEHGDKDIPYESSRSSRLPSEPDAPVEKPHAPAEKRTATFKQLCKDAQISTADVESIFRMVLPIRGKSITALEFSQACMLLGESVHTADMMGFISGLQALNGRMARIGQDVDQAISSLESTSERTLEILQTFYSSGVDQELEVPVHAQHDQGHIGQKHIVESHENKKGALQAISDQDKIDRLWFKFNFVFICVIVLNGIAIGFDLHQEGMPRNPDRPDFDLYAGFWFLSEHILFGVYVGEFCLRVLLHHQVTILGEFDSWLFFPATFFDLTCAKALRAARILPSMLRNDFQITLDFIILCIGAVDNFFLRYAASTTDGLFIVRIFQITRLLRLIRLVHLIPGLSKLWSGFMQTWPLLFWALVTVVLAAYLMALLMVNFVGRGVDALQRWSSVFSSLVALIQIASFDDWAATFEEFGYSAPMMFTAGLIFVIFCGAGVLNLVTGVLVQGAFHMIKESREKSRRLHMLRLEDAAEWMKHLIVRDRRKMDEANFQRLLEEWEVALENHRFAERAASASRDSGSFVNFRMSMRPTDSAGSSEDFGITVPSANVADSEHHHSNHPTRPERPAQTMASDVLVTIKELDVFLQREDLSDRFAALGFRKDVALMVFQKLDILGTGAIPVDDFCEGLVRLQQDAQGLHVAMIKNSLRCAVDATVVTKSEVWSLLLCLQDTVERLRDIRILPDEASMSVWNSALIELRAEQLREDNSRHIRNIHQVRDHIGLLRQALRKMEYGGRFSGEDHSLHEYKRAQREREAQEEEKYCALHGLQRSEGFKAVIAQGLASNMSLASHAHSIGSAATWVTD